MSAITTVVVPTVGRKSLERLLATLAGQAVTVPIIVVDDRKRVPHPLDVSRFGLDITVLQSRGLGPAAARNMGWRVATTPWVSFLDDDVKPEPDWYDLLLEDIESADDSVVGIQGRVTVPLPTDRKPDDAERGTAGLAQAQWITADMTVRREALRAIGGFDERFRRAYREDADLGLRLTQQIGRIVRGRRGVVHPPKRGSLTASIHAQAGNADDMLMLRLHGRRWRELTDAPRGRRRRHLAIVGAALASAGFTVLRRRWLAAAASLLWAAGTTEFAAARILPGPRTPVEVARMTVTSLAIPPLAAWHTARGWLRWRDARPWRGLPELVLWDRDGTLIHDVPYNGDPDRVYPVADAGDALERLRERGIKVGLVTNQSAVGHGMITEDDAVAVNGRVDDLLGPFAITKMCPHAPEDGCACRKPEPGMVLAACAELGADPTRTVVIGDTAADVGAAQAAGALGILVEIEEGEADKIEHKAFSTVVHSLTEAVDTVLSGVR